MTKFSENEMFCNKCLLHDAFWTGGNSWGIDSCPRCGSRETILWKDMSFSQQIRAAKYFDEWWLKKRKTK